MRVLNNTDVDIRDRELVLTRVFNAPRELVYKVWTDPKHVSKWWGPTVFTTPVCEIDLRPGGTYLYVMRSPDGMDFPIQGTFVEVVPNTRLVYTDDSFKQQDFWKMVLGEKLPEVDFSTVKQDITVTFEDVDGKTRLTLVTRFISNRLRDAMLDMQMAEGWTQSWEAFAQELRNA